MQDTQDTMVTSVKANHREAPPMSRVLLLVFIAFGVIGGCGVGNIRSDKEKVRTPIYSYRIINAYNHDDRAFTQGLAFDNGTFYESTGLHGKSTIRKVDFRTGKVLKSYKLPNKYFGEGIAIVGNEIIQITWKSKIGFVYDKNTFNHLKTFHYNSQGWGLTYDGNYLIMSDGSETLRFLHPKTFNLVRKLNVHDDNGTVKKLNELEYVPRANGGEILANIWQSDSIARIDPVNGRVKGWIDISNLLNEDDVKKPADGPNGIAYDSGNKRLFVTGKFWPKVFEIELVLD